MSEPLSGLGAATVEVVLALGAIFRYCVERVPSELTLAMLRVVALGICVLRALAIVGETAFMCLCVDTGRNLRTMGQMMGGLRGK